MTNDYDSTYIWPFLMGFTISWFLINTIFQKKTNRNISNFRKITDNFKTLKEVQIALRNAGMESSELITAVDFTKSNEWTGELSNEGRCLHTFNNDSTPYSRVLSVIAETLSSFDDDQLIPAYGFGDISTKNKNCFSFMPNNTPCKGLDQLLSRYKNIAKCSSLELSGPTNFAPIIYQAIDLVIKNDYRFHILVIVADGQVTNLYDTINAIVEASKYPLSIIVIGVGDGPFSQMVEFDDQLPDRTFDNFQFVDFTKLEKKFEKKPYEHFKAAFAMNALMEIPDQYIEIRKQNLMVNKNTQLAITNRNNVKQPPDVNEYNMTIQSHRIEIDDNSTYPSELVCPITHELMIDPVICTDGHTYDRYAIERWFNESNNTSPLTGAVLPDTTLVRNHAIASQINNLNN